MSNDASKVKVAVTGAVYTGAPGTTLPTTATMALDSAFKDVGYISEDGVTETPEVDTQEIKAWQGGVVVRRVVSSSEYQYKFTMIETKKTSLELYHKGSTVVTDGATGWKLDVKGAAVDRRRFVIDVLDGADVIRIVIPDGEVTDRGEVTYVNEEEIGYEVTITAYPDSNGVVATKYSNSAAWNAA